jgi:multicomponent Na+:H+ antiporter subunit A
MGIDLNFKLDGLSLLFSLLITGIGTLVFAYASYYLKGHRYLDRFYCYLSLFMASMMGLGLSDNVMLHFVFWELTSLSSYLLIGFEHERPAAVGAAKKAFIMNAFGDATMALALFLLFWKTGALDYDRVFAQADDLSSTVAILVDFVHLGRVGHGVVHAHALGWRVGEWFRCRATDSKYKRCRTTI